MSHHWVRAILVMLGFPVAFVVGCAAFTFMDEWGKAHTPNLNTLWGWGPYMGGACLIGMLAVAAWEITR